MGNADKSQKLFLAYNDEFAEVFSAFGFNGEIQLDASQLKDAPTEYEHLEKGKPDELRRDVVKFYQDKHLGIIVVGIENQMQVDCTMPVRMMGYDWVRYSHQIETSEVKNRDLRIYPVVSLVLNFSYKEKWDWPHSLSDLFQPTPGIEKYVQNYKIRVVNLAWLSRKQREKLTGDFRVLVDALCDMRKKGRICGSSQRIKRVKVLLAAMKAIFKEQSFDYLETIHYQEGETTMCEIMEKWKACLIEKGEKRGKEIGEKRGKEIGEKQGAANAKLAVARNLLAMKQLTHKDILQATGISRSQLKKLIDEAKGG